MEEKKNIVDKIVDAVLPKKTKSKKTKSKKAKAKNKTKEEKDIVVINKTLKLKKSTIANRRG